jgi:hypothetical protein
MELAQYLVDRRRTHALFEIQPPAKQFMTTAAYKNLMHFNSPRQYILRLIKIGPRAKSNA